jgi:hypothetical protein
MLFGITTAKNKNLYINNNHVFKKNKDVFVRSLNISFGMNSNPNTTPRVAILDYKNSESTDINGDGKGDILHRDVVKKIIEKTHPNVKCDILFSDTINDTAKNLNNIADELDKGNRLYDAICMPLASFCFLDTLAQQTKLPLTPENLKNYKKKLKTHLKNYIDPIGGKNPYQGVPDIINAIERLTKRKNPVPVFISGGNFDNYNINLYCLADGALNVGSLYADREKVTCNATHSLINSYAQGVYDVFEVKDKRGKLKGYDIEGDSTIFAKPEEVSKGIPFLKNLIGKKIKDLLSKNTNGKDCERKVIKDATDGKEFFNEFNLSGKFFPSEKVAKTAQKLGMKTVTYTPHKGDFIRYDGTYTYFKVDKSGKLYYDPACTGRKDAISSLAGTSFAVPRAVGQYLNEKFNKN